MGYAIATLSGPDTVAMLGKNNLQFLAVSR